MIKQTRGALTMLLSVYRSVLKNAYLKNFAAVALAASVGVASADPQAPSASESLKLQDTPIELTTAAAITAGTENEGNANAASATVNDINISNESGTTALSITANAQTNGTATLTVNEGKTLTVKKGGKVSLTGDDREATSTFIPNAATINGKIVLDAGDAEASTSVLELASGRTVIGDVNVKNGTLTVTGGTASVESIKSEDKGEIAVASDGAMFVEKDLNLNNGATLSNDGSISTFGTATIGKLADGAKLGFWAFAGNAKFTQSENLTIGASDDIRFDKDGTFTGNVTNNGSIVLDKDANVSVKGDGGLTNDGSLTVAANANATLSGKVTNNTEKTITVSDADVGKVTTATFAGDVENAGTISLGDRSVVTFAKALSNSGAVTSSGNLTVTGKLTNSADKSVSLNVANLGEVENSGSITVSSKGNATFGKLTNASGSSLTVTAGADTDNKTVAKLADVTTNEGTITLGANSDVSFEKLVNKSTLNSSVDVLDLVGKLDNTGIVKVAAGTLKASFDSLGLTASGSAAQANVADGATLDIGDAKIEQGIFAASATAGKINNAGTIKAGNLEVTDDADVTLTNAGKLSVDSLSIKKNLNSAETASLTVAKSISTTGENATLGGTDVSLANDGKVNGSVTGFKSVVAKIAGLWDLGKADLGAATIDNATVTNVGDIDGATIGSATKATVTANTVKAATIGKGSTVTATTVNAATLTDKSVLNADKIDATAASSAPIALNDSTLNVGSVAVTAGTDPAHVAISASNGSTVKITGEYKAVTKGLVANLAGSTLELNANNNKSDAGIETIRGDETSTLLINGVSGSVKLSTDTALSTSLTDGADGTLAGLYKKIGVNGTNFTGQIKGLKYDTADVVEDGKIALTEIGSYSTVASSTDAFATAQVTGVNTTLDSKLNVGSILAENGTATVDIGASGDIDLNTAKDGLLVAQAGATATDAATAANVEFSDDGKLALNGDGKIGNIDAGAAGNGTLSVSANVEAGKIGETNAIKELTVSSGTLTAKSVIAQTTTVDGNLVADSLTAATSATINGGLTLAKNDSGATGLLSTGTLTTENNAVVKAESITATGASALSGKVTVSDTLTTNSLDVGAVDTSGAVTSTGTVSAKTLVSSGAVNVKAGSLSVTGDTPTTLSAGLTVGKAGAVSFAKDITLDSVASSIEGSLSANVLKSDNALSVYGGGNVNVAELTGSGDITIGQDGVNNGTGSVYANKLTSTGKIFIDPDFGQAASIQGAQHLNTDSNGIEVTTGDIVVGKNAAFAVGVSSVDQARSVLSSLGLTDANGSFSASGVKNAIYTDALVKLSSTKALEIDASNTTGSVTATAGQIKLGDQSAVVIGKNAAAKSVETGKAVLTAEIAGAGVVLANATDKAKVIFAGNSTKQDIKDVKVFGNADSSGTVISTTDAANISVQLSPLYNLAKLTVDGGITDITVNRGYINTALYNASLPVKNMVAEVADTALTGDGVGSDFIMENALVDGGANIESAARLATFGGAYQAATAAVNTAVEAAQARLGLGIDNSAEVKGENVSVWANAVYKNTESDSFEAQGTTYGSDLDLTSLVIGADYGIAEGSKIGAYASFGTGDVDGKGAGHNVKNDVDTYGFGIYGSTKLASGVSILSDVGYTVAQNEFKGIVSADADMKVFTAGANVKYTFNTQVADITPFVGARYTSFNLESYAVKSAKGIVANTDADTAHIFSIPVGFDLSKQIAAGEWNVKPALTAKVTFNTGDKSVSSSTQFTGVKNALNLDAEVMDDVTYSVGASVSATKGAATFGAGLSYTGSSETNELSAQVGARYTF